MFSIGDHVLHGTTGVCEIIGIRLEKFGDFPEQEYYVIKPLYTNSLTYIATSNDKELKQLRPVMTKDEVFDLIQNMPKEKNIWIKNDSERRDSFLKKVKTGDSHDLVRLIRTLYLEKIRKKTAGKVPNSTDAKIMTIAERLLHEEFAFVLRINANEVVQFIRGRLH